jgi:hypothetical protein
MEQLAQGIQESILMCCVWCRMTSCQLAPSDGILRLKD